MFTPEEIIFVPTQGCNLKCSHCFVPNNPQKLDLEKSKVFLQNAAKDGIMYLGFSGGEPFLNIHFLTEIIKFAVENEMIFDRLMTNAVWWQTENQLKKTLQELFDCGFDGTIGISFDCFHSQEPKKIATFIKIAQEIFEDTNICNLVYVQKNDTKDENKQTKKMYKELCKLLNAKLIKRKNKIISIKYKTKTAQYKSNEINISCIDYVYDDCNNPKAWQDKEWFIEDFCQGPGNVYYIHGNGDVACCCGYANEQNKLILGNINSDSYQQIKKNAIESNKNGFLETVYNSGLLKIAKKMEENGHVFPGKGKTKNNCQFCRYLLSQNKN